ncbi:nucleotidyltransferase family protein [Litorilinea aerophila]|nr:nucleotidyltransferase family protein [Litorilinea aerophila]MCC9076253.1 nucleotidyltransferase family protein [Litorilinea aerophila]
MVSPDQITATLSPEFRLLLACSRPHLDPAGQAKLRALVHRPLCPDTFVALAATHQVLSLAYRHLQRLHPDFLQHPAGHRLALAARRWAGRSLLLGRELGRLFQAGIPALAYKGPVLAQQYYGQCWLRPAQDLDLLAPASAWPAVRRTLLAHGYQPVCSWHPGQREALQRLGSHEAFWHPGRQLRLELHSRLLPIHHQVPLTAEQLWHARRPVSFQDTTIETLAPSHLLLALCIHGAKHRWERLKWVVDVAVVAEAHPDLDWPSLLEEVTRLGLRRLLLLGLALAHGLLAAPVPAEIRQAIHGDPAIHSLVRGTLALWQEPGSGSPPVPFSAYAYYLRARERPGDRLRFVAALLGQANPLDMKARQLPSSLMPAYRLLRPVRLVRTHGCRLLLRTLGQLIRTFGAP